MPMKFKMRRSPAAVGAHACAASVSEALGVAPLVARILAARGMTDPEDAQRFVSPSLERDWRDPYEIAGLAEAVERMEAAVRSHEHIVVFGDFDLDGISATTVMTRGIRALGGRVTPFIPKRFEEGYGLTEAAIRRMRGLAPDLVVTVDCGISCKNEAASLLGDGVDVIVTDHHEAGGMVPEGVPVVDPKAQPGCPSAILAGVGVALKVVQALGSRLGFPHLWRDYADFAALGTVADLMPMLGENRSLVSDGLRLINESPRPCIAALVSVAGMAGKGLTASNLSFTLVPRLNAAGRMGNAELALDLLMSDSFEEASSLAQRLDALNSTRREIESELSEAAEKKVASEYAGERAIVVAGEGWHEGVKGIVASRLVGAYGVPALLFTIDGGEARGSGRSVGNINLFAAIESTSDLLTRFGGHASAVGVTLPVENLDAFKARLCAYMDSVPADEFEPALEIDALVGLGELTLDTVEQIGLLAPFGQENPEPVLMARGVLLEQCRAVGADKNHFSCKLTDGRSHVSGILFHCKNIDALMLNESIVDAAFTVQVDEWRGARSVKAMLKELACARSCCGLDACVDPEVREFMEGLYGACEGAGADGGAGAAGPAGERAAAESAAGGGAVPAEDGPAEAERQRVRERWSRLAATDPASLEREIVRAIIGEGVPHATQREMLDALERGRSVLGVMATGRGKSLVFQVHAAMIALAERKASLFVYPLRALMSDQAFHLGRQFARFGLSCRVLNGETPEPERESVYAGLADGTVDIVLTTPEYLSFHAGEIARCARIGFMVVDEAHHIGQAKAGTRTAYKELGRVAALLGNPVVLAVTATATADVAHDIEETLPIEDSVIDDTSRDNLLIDDQRGVRNRDDYLAHIVASGQKCIVYVNSREVSVAVARQLRMRVPQLAPFIGFYNAGIRREERSRIEELFRSGGMQVLVATSAFGEGVDIPDVRHVVLYHMPFSDIEFNQMAGRAGRDGKDAWVHLLYGRQDMKINRGILEDMTPDRDVMAQVYRRLRSMARAAEGGGCFSAGIRELAELASDAARPVSEQAVSCGIAVFDELGLIEATRTYNSGKEEMRIRVIEGAAKVELTDSVRYLEGRDEISSFMAFRDWAMKCDVEGLRVRVTHPISPEQL